MDAVATIKNTFKHGPLSLSFLLIFFEHRGAFAYTRPGQFRGGPCETFSNRTSFFFVMLCRFVGGRVYGKRSFFFSGFDLFWRFFFLLISSFGRYDAGSFVFVLCLRLLIRLLSMPLGL